MIFFDNLITHERDLPFGLQSSLDIHTPALNFCHLAGATVPSSGWRLAHYRPRRHLATYYALRWRSWLPENPSSPAVATRNPIGRGRATNQRRETPPVTFFFSVQRCDTLRRYRREALLANELTRSRPRHLERHYVTAPLTISVLLSVHRSPSPPTDYSGGDGKSLSV